MRQVRRYHSSMKILILLCLLSTSAFAQKIVVFAGDTLGYPADPLCYFSNSKMIAHPEGFLVKYACFGRSELYGELWLVRGEKSVLIAQSSPGNVLGDPVVLDDKIYVTEFNELRTEKFFQYDGELREFPLPANGIDVRGFAPVDGKLLFRYIDEEGMSGEGTWADGQWSLLPKRGISYFFTAGWSSEVVVQKVRLGDLSESSPDHIEIRRAPDFTPIVVAQDQDQDPSSPFKGFFNYAVASGKRWVMTASTDKGVVALKGMLDSYEVVELYKFFRSVDSWPATISDDGAVIIRAQHLDGRYGLWKVTTDAKLLLQTGDVIDGLGAGSVLFYNAPLMSNGKVLIGIGLEKDGGSVGQGIVSLPL